MRISAAHERRAARGGRVLLYPPLDEEDTVSHIRVLLHPPQAATRNSALNAGPYRLVYSMRSTEPAWCGRAGPAGFKRFRRELPARRRVQRSSRETGKATSQRPRRPARPLLGLCNVDVAAQQHPGGSEASLLQRGGVTVQGEAYCQCSRCRLRCPPGRSFETSAQ